jgi:hypothetical protein
MATEEPNNFPPPLKWWLYFFKAFSLLLYRNPAVMYSIHRVMILAFVSLNLTSKWGKKYK